MFDARIKRDDKDRNTFLDYLTEQKPLKVKMKRALEILKYEH